MIGGTAMRRWQSFLWLWFCTAAVGFVFSTVRGEPARPPVGVELQKAVATVEEIYKDKARQAKTPIDQAALAREIFGNRASTATSAELYAMEVAAVDLATKSDDPLLLIKICEQLGADFGMDPIALVTARVGQTAGAINPANWPPLAEKLSGMASACLENDRFGEALEIATAFSQLAKRTPDPKANSAATLLRKTVAERKKARERLVELKGQADQSDASPKAMLEFGRLLCFSENDWPQGVGYLARGDDPLLAAAAAKEWQAKTPEEKLAAAEAWAAVAEKAQPGSRTAIRAHVVTLYTTVIPLLTGLAKVKAEKSLDEVLNAARTGRDTVWTVLFRSNDPTIWNTNMNRGERDLAFPIDHAPANTRYIRLRLESREAMILPITRQQLAGTHTIGDFVWIGSKTEVSGAPCLGIASRSMNVRGVKGEVIVAKFRELELSGWGFGHRCMFGGPPELCWSGSWRPKQVLEISASAGPLSPTELESVLK